MKTSNRRKNPQRAFTRSSAGGGRGVPQSCLGMYYPVLSRGLYPVVSWGSLSGPGGGIPILSRVPPPPVGPGTGLWTGAMIELEGPPERTWDRRLEMDQAPETVVPASPW